MQFSLISAVMSVQWPFVQSVCTSGDSKAHLRTTMISGDLSHHFQFSISLWYPSDNYHQLGSCPKSNCWRLTELKMLPEAMNLCGVSRHRCRADHSYAAIGNNPSGNPGTEWWAAYTQHQKLADLGLWKPYLGVSIFMDVYFLCKTIYSHHVTQRLCVTKVFLLGQGRTLFFPPSGDREGGKIIWRMSLHQRQEVISQNLFQLQTNLETSDPQLNPLAYGLQRASSRVTALERLYVYDHADWAGKFQL